MGRVLVIPNSDFSNVYVEKVDITEIGARGNISSKVIVLADDTVISRDAVVGTPRSTWLTQISSRGLYRTREVSIKAGYHYDVSISYVRGSGFYAGIVVDSAYTCTKLCTLKSVGGAETITFSFNSSVSDAKLVLTTPWTAEEAAISVVESEIP